MRHNNNGVPLRSIIARRGLNKYTSYITAPLKALEFIGLCETMPHVDIALRISLTTPVTVASGERSFSKLKLLETYLKYTMTQQRLVGLSLMASENGIASGLDYSQLIDEFALIKS